MTRQRKTPAQRAEEALGVAQRRVDRLVKQTTDARADLEALEQELAEAEARLTYVKADPALKHRQIRTTTTPGGTTA